SLRFLFNLQKNLPARFDTWNCAVLLWKKKARCRKKTWFPASMRRKGGEGFFRRRWFLNRESHRPAEKA
ncbi:hypothetical protein, partial [Ruthenibacterium lactatiformans]|uniref:hypothetical protein n=1 Tax=Ruthenibacterium lactatiformans TaxID=1550024 RepID=UPI0039A3219B